MTCELRQKGLAERPPAMLASVTSVAEAELCVNAGADVIDCKEPKSGALGALPLRVVRDICRQVDGRCLVSATIGDLYGEAFQFVGRSEEMAATGVDLVKVGLASGAPELDLAGIIGALGTAELGSAGLVGVLFADQHPNIQGLVALMSAWPKFCGVMLDTANKKDGSLTAHIEPKALHDFVRLAHRNGRFAGLAGSLGVKDVSSFCGTGVDVLGFRGGLCVAGDRGQMLDLSAVKRVRDCLDLVRDRWLPESVPRDEYDLATEVTL